MSNELFLVENMEENIENPNISHTFYHDFHK